MTDGQTDGRSHVQAFIGYNTQSTLKVPASSLRNKGNSVKSTQHMLIRVPGQTDGQTTEAKTIYPLHVRGDIMIIIIIIIVVRCNYDSASSKIMRELRLC